MTTEKKPRVTKPPAEIVGSFADAVKRNECNDGRSLFRFWNGKTETYILAASELQAWKALHSSLGIIERISRVRMEKLQREELLKLMEEQNGEPQEPEDEK